MVICYNELFIEGVQFYLEFIMIFFGKEMFRNFIEIYCKKEVMV